MEKEIINLLKKMDTRLDSIENRLDNIDTRLGNVENRLDKVENRLGNVENRLDRVEARQKEDHEILTALVHSSEVSKTERDKITHDIAHIKGSLESINDNLSKVEIVTASNWADIAKLKAAK